MQANARKREPVKPINKVRAHHASTGGQTKKVPSDITRKINYRVGYSWNKGGRLKELRIRHLARKFLRLWMQKTFGRIHPYTARLHHKRRVLLQAFEIWKDEWWTTRREWTLTVRADCHYRYRQCTRTFHSWQKYTSSQRKKKKKIQNAQNFADRQVMHVALDKWGLFVEMRRMKGRMLESALQQKRHSTLCSFWDLWQTALQKRYDVHALEDKALQYWAMTLQSRVWLQWREMYKAACNQKESESKALHHYHHTLQKKAVCSWMEYVHYRQAKKKLQAVADQTGHLSLVRNCWSKWCIGLNRLMSEKDRWQAAEHLAEQSLARRTLLQWRTYVKLCHEEADKMQVASQHQHLRMLHTGLRGLSLNVTMSKTFRLNKNMAVQHNHHTTTKKYWRLWHQRLEEAEDEAVRPQIQTASTHYSTSLLNHCFQHWKEELAEHTYMKGLEICADAWFAEHRLPQFFNLWVEYTLKRRMHKEENQSAEIYNQRRLYTWVFYTWWEHSEERKDQRMSDRMAILHEERWCVQRAWRVWRQRAQQKIDDREKQRASDNMYLHRLLHKTLSQWKDNAAEIRDRRNQDEQARHRGDLCRMRWAMDRWHKYVESQKEKRSRLEQVDQYHDVRLVRHTFQAWKEYQHQTADIYSHAEKCYRLQQERSLRRVLAVWKENTLLQAQARRQEQRAQSHFQRCLQAKVLLAWRQATVLAVSKHDQQRELLTKSQSCIDQVRLGGSFRSWRRRATESMAERMGMDKARQHHHSTLLCKVMTAWKRHHDSQQKYQVMKRQGVLLLRLKVCQSYFERWKIELQHRRREAEQTEVALWHWSLGLQAKVLYSWRLWLKEKHRKEQRLARAAHVYRDHLLREGVACILTYTAHMKSFSTSLAQRSQAQNSQHLQEVVHRCAMRWKQRALYRPGKGQGVRGEGQTPKKSVTFSLPTPGLGTKPHGASIVSSVEKEVEESILNQLSLTRASRLQPRCRKDLLNSPVKELHQSSTQRQSARSHVKDQYGGQQKFQVLADPHPAGKASGSHQAQTPVPSFLKPPTVADNCSSSALTQSPLSPVPHTYPSVSYHGPQDQEVLLPPSSFMATSTQAKLRASSSPCPSDGGLLPLHQFTLPLNQHSSSQTGVRLKSFGEDGEENNEEEDCVESESAPVSALRRELLTMREDMERYQQDRKQLQAWQRLKEVLKSWLLTSGKEEQMERDTVTEELEELEERIRELSVEVAKQKPAMLLHAARIQHLESVRGHLS